jgi:hypothetical protein
VHARWREETSLASKDRSLAREYMLKVSMIDGLRRAAATA